MNIENTSLTIVQRAVVAIGIKEREIELIALAAKTTDIATITNKDGYDQVHASRMVLKAERVDIEKRGKAAREDANKFADAIIAEQKRLIAIVKPEEDRLEALQKQWDADREKERQAKIAAEQKRVQDIRSWIGRIAAWPQNAIGKPASLVEQQLATANDYVIDETFAEFKTEASSVLAASREALSNILSERREFETEQARINTERQELELARAAQAAEDRKAKAKRDAEEAVMQKQRDDLARQQREQAQKQADIDRQAEALRIASLPKPEPIAQVASPPPAISGNAFSGALKKRVAYKPKADFIIGMVAIEFGVSKDVALAWLAAMDFKSLSEAAA